MIALTTNGRLYKTSDGRYYTPIVYGYDFFKRYISFFGSVKLLAHVKSVPDSFIKNMLRVDGPGLSISDLYFPKNKLDFLFHKNRIKREISAALNGCKTIILRIPDQLAFLVFDVAKKKKMTIGSEVNSNSWDFFARGSYKSIFRPFLRFYWDKLQKKTCLFSDATCYVTKHAIQKRYPPSNSKNCFSNNCSDVDISKFLFKGRKYSNRVQLAQNWVHVSGSIGGIAKGHKETIKAASLLKKKYGIDVTIHFVGSGALSKQNIESIKKNNVSVVCHGSICSDKIATLFKEADFFVFPSYREGLPRVVIEAMASSLVCVATKLDGILELIDEDYLVPVKNHKLIAETIYRISRNIIKLEKIAEENYHKSLEYSPEVLEKHRKEFYSFLLKNETP